MKCQVCQADLSVGATFCTNCGTPVPSNPYGNPASPSSPNQGIAPTMLASSAPQPDPYGAPPANLYGGPPSAPNPYGAPANPYGTPSTGYGSDMPSAPNPYGTPASAPYGAPPAYNPAPGSYGQPYMPPQPQPKKGPNGCVIAIIIVVSLLVLIGGGVFALGAFVVHKASGVVTNLDATATADMGTANALLSPTTASGGSGVPNASQVDPKAAANIFNIQTANQVDSNYKPTNVTSSFATTDTIYITYDHNDAPGYIIEKTYDSTGALVVKSSSPHSVASDISNGYISLTNLDPGSYTTGVYWCGAADCSDAALAKVVTFSVS